jgi:hypothetical protein
MIWLGIDPGKEGGLSAIALDDTECVPMPGTEADIWAWFRWYSDRPAGDVFAYVEVISPAIFMINKSSNSKLYGNYCSCRMALIGNGIPFQAVEAKHWQRALGLPAKKDENRTAWKNRLKQLAQQLFPSVTITLLTADSLLIAEYCRRTRGEGNHAKAGNRKGLRAKATRGT